MNTVTWLLLSATVVASPLQNSTPPSVKIGKRYGSHADGYSVAGYAHDQAAAKRYATDFAREHNLKPEAQERIAKARLVELRTRHYPHTWSQQQKMRLYRKEMLSLDRLVKERDAYDPVAHAPHPFTDKFLEWQAEQKKIAKQEKRNAAKSKTGP